MSFNESVLICDEVAPVLNKVLKENGLKITYEPQITPEQIKEKIGNYNIVIVILLAFEHFSIFLLFFDSTVSSLEVRCLLVFLHHWLSSLIS